MYATIIAQDGELPEIIGGKQCYDEENNVVVWAEGFFDMFKIVQRGSKLFNVVHCLNFGLRVWDGVHWAEFSVEVLEITRLADHGSIVSSIRERRDMNHPMVTTA